MFGRIGGNDIDNVFDRIFLDDGNATISYVPNTEIFNIIYQDQYIFRP
jgi:hypothetical protein